MKYASDVNQARMKKMPLESAKDISNYLLRICSCPVNGIIEATSNNLMAPIVSNPYNSVTFENSLSLRVDGGVGSISINPSGRDVVLAGCRGLYVVDLDDPFSPPRWLHHLTSWEVADVQWSPHSSKPSWVMSTSNQKALLWNLARNGDDAIEHVLHGHSRAITDINFHPNHPELLATCSVDTFVLAWDMRTPRRPIFEVADWRAGASQVKWNFQNPNILASSHDNYFYIWDIRNQAKAVHKIYAHTRKINGVDFSRTKENEIISASNDYTVKYWDISKDTNTPESTINTSFQVWRARHLPFGDGCAIIPLTGGDNSIYLAKHKDIQGDTKFSPSHVFKGHSDRVTDFLWRSRHTDSGYDDREFQLVTWSKDSDLRLWSLNDEIYSQLDYKRGEPVTFPEVDYKTYREEPESTTSIKDTLKINNEMFVSGRGDFKSTTDHLHWISGVRIGRSAFSSTMDQNPNKPLDNSLDNLGEELTVIGHKFPKVKFERISVSTGTLDLSLNGPWNLSTPEDLVFLRIEIKFPKEYPSSAPVFKIEENNNLTKEARDEIFSGLSEITKIYARFSQYSLEVCLRFLMGDKVDLETLGQDIAHQESEGYYNLPSVDEANDFESSLSSLNSSANELSDSESYIENESADDDELVSALQNSQGSVNESRYFDSTPLPKGCGATWTTTGKLVCFFMPKQSEKRQKNIIKFDRKGFGNQVLYQEDEELSDDSLSDDLNDILRKDLSSRKKITGVFRIQNFNNLSKYDSDKVSSMLTETTKSHNSLRTGTINKNVVAIFDFSDLIPSKYELSSEYKVVGDSAEKLSLHNSLICEDLGYSELADTWRLLSMILTKDFYWGVHPIGRTWFINELMKYYERLGDVQMLAMMSCIIQGSKSAYEEQEADFYQPLMKEPHTFQRNYRLSSMGSSESTLRLPFSRSSSIATTKEIGKTINVKVEMFNEGEMGYSEDTFKFKLLDEEDPKYDRYREEYSNMLYSWGQNLRRAEILKFNYENSLVCKKLLTDGYQAKVKIAKNDRVCVYCNLKTSRTTFVCFKCHHVLHTNCAKEWWEESNECCTGCGCTCLEKE